MPKLSRLNRIAALVCAVAGLALGPVFQALAGERATRQPDPREHYDLVVYGATPDGVAAAVRVAWESLSVLLVSAQQRLGGIFSNGRSLMDTRYHGARAPIYDELRRSIHDYYRIAYGAGSEQYYCRRPGAERGVGISFFNDVEVDPREPWIPAVQYFGTQGFFGSYEADPLDALPRDVAEVRVAAAAEWVSGTKVDPNLRASRVLAAEGRGGEPLLANEFARLLAEALAGTSNPWSIDGLLRMAQLEGIVRISRGNACRMKGAPVCARTGD